MPTYVFRCKTHGLFELVRKIDERGADAQCPECGMKSTRIFSAVPDIWRTDGSHKGDYGTGNDGQAGDKATLLNKRWEEYYGEKAPPPDPNAPKNYDVNRPSKKDRND